MSDDTRTTPIGLFNYARSYWQSAVLLHEAKVKVTHPNAPITLLMAHAIELYLKAFLRLRGLSVDEVKSSFGHNFSKLAAAAEAHGLSLMDEDKDVAAILTEQESIRRSRYIETGYFQQPSLSALSRTCRSLDEAVAPGLQGPGVELRTRSLRDIEE